MPKSNLLVKTGSADAVMAEAIIRTRARKAQREAFKRGEAPDIVDWAHENYRIPETGGPIELLPHQQAILRLVFTRRDNRLPYTTFIYATPKKSGKTAIAGLIARWRAESVLFGEVYCVGNDGEQAKERGFRAAKRSIMLTPGFIREGTGGTLPNCWQATERHLRHLVTGTVVKAIPVDAPGEAGANPDLTIWTELWGMQHGSALQFWEEMTPVPTRPDSMRVVETYAGYEGESDLLKGLYDLGVEGRQLTAGELSEKTGCPLGVFEEATQPEDLVPIWVNGNARLCMYWDEGEIGRRMPWQRGKLGEEYYREEASLLPTRAYERIHLNKWVGAEGQFVPMEWWDACYDPNLPPLDTKTPIVLAADAATTADCFAIVAGSRHPHDSKRVAVRACQIWTPHPGMPIDFEEAEQWLRGIIERCNVEQLAYDCFQLFEMMQRFKREQVCWVKEFGQQKPRAEADRALYDLIRQRQIAHNGDPGLREHIQNANVKLQRDEDSKMRIIKKRAGKKIDAAVATSMMAARVLYLDL